MAWTPSRFWARSHGLSWNELKRGRSSDYASAWFPLFFLIRWEMANRLQQKFNFSKTLIICFVSELVLHRYTTSSWGNGLDLHPWIVTPACRENCIPLFELKNIYFLRKTYLFICFIIYLNISFEYIQVYSFKIKSIGKLQWNLTKIFTLCVR